ncbi:MAG: glycosyl hydrolase family 28-related protein [Verrucomicrobiae bacterium]|nr:glycosyl hydrolase family 28-related protein [Verrucomicrobiae bacterium]
MTANAARIDVSTLGIYGDGVTDVSVALQSALSTYKTLYMPAGTYVISNTISFPSGGDILGAGSNTIIKPTSTPLYAFKVVGTDTTYISNTVVDSLTFAGTPGQIGFLAKKAYGVTVRRCSTSQGIGLFKSVVTKVYTNITSEADLNRYLTVISNTVNASSSSPSVAVGIDFEFSADCEASANTVNYYYHGIMWWGGDSNLSVNGALANPRWARRIHIGTNSVSNAGQGGIWGSMGQNVTIERNEINYCGDVGLDLEGCFNSVAQYNYVTNGVNGSLATFYSASNVLFAFNTVVTTDATRPIYRLYNSSLDPSKVMNLTLSNNILIGSGCIGDIDDSSGAGYLTIVGNTMTNVFINLTRGGSGFNGAAPIITKNTLTYTIDLAQSMTAIDSYYYFGNPTIGANTVIYNGATTSNKIGIRVRKLAPATSTVITITNNTVKGCSDADIYVYATTNGVTANIKTNTVQFGQILVGQTGLQTVNAAGNKNLSGATVNVTWLSGLS